MTATTEQQTTEPIIPILPNRKERRKLMANARRQSRKWVNGLKKKGYTLEQIDYILDKAEELPSWKGI